MTEEENSKIGLLLLPRREPFEHGLLPIPKLILPFETLISFRSNSKSNIINSQILSDSLQISNYIADLVIESLNSVLESNHENGEVGLYDLLLFLYVQGYKRLVLRNSKDAAAIADVWRRVSAFEGCMSAMSPVQVLTLERFKHLEFLMKFVERSGEVLPFKQAVPLFANSDSAPAAQVLEWILQKTATSLEFVLEKSPRKENGSNTVKTDNSTSDASTNNCNEHSRSQTCVEGVIKSSITKPGCDIKGHCVKVLNCHDSGIYILAPLRYATVYGCSESTIVLGAIGKAVKDEHCERVQIITAAKRICIANCRECVFFLGVNQQPLIIGDNRKLLVAPYNTYYPELEEHMAQVDINANINKWNELNVLGMVDPHDSLSHPAGVSEVQPESVTCLDPDHFTNFVIPKYGTEPAQPTKDNPFSLPESYASSLKKTSEMFQVQVLSSCGCSC